MAGERSWFGLDEDDSREVPRLDWEQLEITEHLGDGRNSAVFGAFLRMKDGRTVEVAVKENKKNARWWSVHHEAEVLQTLEGVRGVPKFYGVTKTFPHALVMSRCRGITVKELKRRGHIRSCLTAVLDICTIVSQLHKQGICHRDLHGGNILVDSTARDEDGDVWLIDFGQARMYATKLSMQIDEAHVLRLLRDILHHMIKASDRNFSRRYNDVLTNLPPEMSLREISSKVHSLIYGHSTLPSPDA